MVTIKRIIKRTLSHPLCWGWLLFVGITLIAGPIGAQQTKSLLPAGREPSTPPFKVDVNLVLVNASVTDIYNRFVVGLEKEHFQVFEDKVEQTITQFSSEDTPASIGLLFDVSNSMSEKLTRSKDAAVAFLKTSNPQDEFFLITFNDSPKLDDEFTSDINTIQNQLALKTARGCTTLYDTIYLALAKLRKAHNPKKALLLITDGEDTCSRYLVNTVKNAVKEADVQIFAIGILDSGFSGPGLGLTGRTVLEDLAEVTGGSAYFPRSVYELEDICTKIAIEIRNQYVLGYSPKNLTKDGSWRKIRVKVNPPPGMPSLSVHSKTGYYAPSG